MLRIFLTLVIVVLPLFSKHILFYNDFCIDQTAVDAIVADLKAAGHDVIVADSAETFERFLSKSGRYKSPDIDVAVLALQDRPLGTEAFPNYLAFVRNGAPTLFIDGNRGRSWADFFGFSYTRHTNMDNVTFVESIGIGDLPLYNPGYHNFSMGLVPQKEVLASFDQDDAAVLFLDGHVIINGFLLDTVKTSRTAPKSADAEPRTIRTGPTPMGTLLTRQINLLLAPPAQSSAASSSSSSSSSSVSSGSTTQNNAANTADVDVPIGKRALTFLLMMITLSALFFLGRRQPST